MKFWLPYGPMLTKKKKKKFVKNKKKKKFHVWAYGPGEATTDT